MPIIPLAKPDLTGLSTKERIDYLSKYEEEKTQYEEQWLLDSSVLIDNWIAEDPTLSREDISSILDIALPDIFNKDEIYREPLIQGLQSSNIDIPRFLIFTPPTIPGRDNQSSTLKAKSITKWEQVTVTLLNNEDIKVQMGDKTEAISYVELGFKDNKKKSGVFPTAPWNFFLNMIHVGRVDTSTQNPDLNQKQRDTMKQMIAKLRKGFKDYLKIPGDPFPYWAGRVVRLF
ncbi:MAG: hypothetical protein HQL68_00520 [Magnetococcales bacterium]|nr:hypothetical protein [Magnetococcales bacterium]